MKIDLEQLKVMKEIFTHQHMGEVVPVQAAPSRDSFAVFTDGLKNNWIFVMAVFAVGMWMFNSINDQKSANAFQDVQIKTNIEDISQNAADIEQLDKNLSTLNQSQVAGYNELVRRLDSLQASIDALKNAP
jgi:hypothetical protein